MDPITAIVALLSLFGLIGSAITNRNNQAKQIEHDKEMAELQKQNEKELMDYEVELSQSNNTIATQSGHAAAAGFSPALMFGSSFPAVQGASGSASGSASQLEPLRLFDKLSTRDTVEPILQKSYQDMQQQKITSDVARNQSEVALNNARAMEQIRDTAQRRNLEKVVYDQAMASLDLTHAQRGQLEFLTARGNALLPGELESQGLINAETSAKITKIHSDVSRNSWEMRQIQHDIKRIDSVTKLNESAEALNREDSLRVQEQVRSSAVGRIMQEFGLTKRITPSQFRDANSLHNL